MLVVSLVAQTSSAFFYHGIAFLIPALQRAGLSLSVAGTVVAMPVLGVMLTLIGWGAIVDRVGERRVLVAGTALTAAATAGAALAAGLVAKSGLLLVGGMAAASTAAASGRVVVGWFPPNRRGLTMGIRQMAQPLGVGVAAVVLPTLALRYGVGPALWLPAALSLVSAVACVLVIVDPPRPDRQKAAATGQLDNPYRGGGFLWRVHAVSALLVVPQFTVWTFALVWLINDRGWSAVAAGTLVAVAQVLGALGRLAAGQLSDWVGNRMRPLRWVAVTAAVLMAGLGATAELGWSVAVVLLVAASVVTVADNGLAFTSIAETAGPFWSGRALGAQNTAQFLTAAAVPPVIGALISVAGFPLAFALVALCPVAAAPLVPVRLERAPV